MSAEAHSSPRDVPDGTALCLIRTRNVTKLALPWPEMTKGQQVPADPQTHSGLRAPPAYTARHEARKGSNAR